MNQTGFPERSVLLAPFGRHTRHILLSYIRHALVVSVALLSVALTIDLVPQLSKVVGNMTGLDSLLRLSWFMLLRSADLLPRFIPLASFLGVLWTETVHTISRERILVWNTGRSPFRCLIPAALLALIFGAIQFACDSYLRPAAMAVQVEQHLGTYGETFDRRLSKDSHWIAAGDDLVIARLDFGPPPKLRDLTLYRLNENGRLREVDTALTAIPGTTKGRWILQDGSYWVIPPENITGNASVPLLSRGTKASAIKFQERQIKLSVDPVWITVWGFYPQYVPHDILRTLTQGATADDPRYLFVTRFEFDYADALMPGVMALLAATLSLLLFAYAAPLGLQFAMLPVGYAGHLAMKTFVLMGENDYMTPLVAAWAAPLGLLMVSGLLLTTHELRRRRA